MFPQKRGYSTIIGYFNRFTPNKTVNKKLRRKITHKKTPAFSVFNVRHSSFTKYYSISTVLSRFFDF